MWRETTLKPLGRLMTPAGFAILWTLWLSQTKWTNILHDGITHLTFYRMSKREREREKRMFGLHIFFDDIKPSHALFRGTNNKLGLFMIMSRKYFKSKRISQRNHFFTT
jgi:hypothetical protein